MMSVREGANGETVMLPAPWPQGFEVRAGMRRVRMLSAAMGHTPYHGVAWVFGPGRASEETTAWTTRVMGRVSGCTVVGASHRGKAFWLQPPELENFDAS